MGTDDSSVDKYSAPVAVTQQPTIPSVGFGQGMDLVRNALQNVGGMTPNLLPNLNVKLIPQLEKLKPGSRIVSHAFDMEGVKPDKVVHVRCKDDIDRTVYLWVTPLKKEK